MALTQDILATYRGPGRVVAQFLSQGRNEVRALLFVLIAGILMFIASTPFQAREAQLDPDIPLEARLYWSALFYILMLPILIYVFALIITGLARIARRQISGYEIRFTLIWALLASTPVMLLVGLVAGFIGTGIQLQLVGLLWFAVFGWFWIAGLMRADGAS
ncbi:hypothetical protein [Sulfitobacter guttiformis]|uniref:Yip1-like protein n=1 Tax=Sulfitobacter guttiformis TaxID=74349 RepID=A0A420DHY7_9RHOB|nr:hypothetical protein [Sulfitobacter guttiformis]KIN72433.1 hypothetical protein Z949_1606 [Sulfitobacter guttiformis KCTC 32187]RKE93815.1 hypothetical protein C8N30_2913 [Sulfitobacter guttiformis]